MGAVCCGGGIGAADPLRDIDANNVAARATRFTLVLHGQPCKVVRVYDGDTVTVVWTQPQAIRVGRNTRVVQVPTYASVRLAGFDTPEIRTKDPREKADAIRCRDMMADLVLNQTMLMDVTGLDKYGRPLATLRAGPMTGRATRDALGERSVNEWAVATLPKCTPYDGKTKTAYGART